MNYKELLQYCEDHGYDHYDEMPEGWKFVVGATTAPWGAEWICNGLPLLKGRKSALLITVENKS